MKRRRLYIRTHARADITELWVVKVPHDLDVDEGNALDVLQHPEQFGAEVRSVTNEDTSNEQDRAVFDIEDFTV
jgi:hypothetical protein